MHPTPSLRSALAVGAAAAVLLTATGRVAAAPASAPAVAVAARPAAPVPPSSAAAPHAASAPPAATAHSPYGQLRPLAELSAERLATGDSVAAAKWGTGSPIDDPAREQEVLDTVADQARRLGADPAATVRVFRDQIEANKVVQRGLYRRWDADPAQAPTQRPDLQEVRKEINRINGALVRALAGSPRARSAPYCAPLLTAAAVRVHRQRRLDTLHATALARSLRSVCTGA
ncbi:MULTISPECIES: chorismate mutase [unclassified Streptomyces]|uniref:chorismate mutase n=1 Tax=unclassified Streptomyces TaxID=2593676 RepID=UPI0008896AB6|nr:MULTISPECIES: chorismate mutase [unclassified Streptomyces]PBC81022.1 chorismate mutase [Streptomyces sp. 2321.6]SDR56657.1 chorismate mutase [Streptomyces sp. KS_16]SEB98117.1 chorismate mutase [Streptomyces sp. 2133.1]SNC63327.1 chorismate mutase [Streptomyces sp. 2114.4]